MTQILTEKDLTDGRLDIKSLGEAANGDENTTVVTRTGETYPSAKKAIKTMFEAGALPAEPFSTKEEMEISPLPDDSYAVVLNDDVVDNNGYYQKLAGVWVYLKYNPYQQAKTYTDTVTEATVDHIDQKTAPLITSSGKALFQFLDADLNIVSEIDENAGLRLVGVEGSVQDAINSNTKAANSFGNTGNYSHVFTDADDNILAAIDNDAGLHLLGVEGTVQEAIKGGSSASQEASYIRELTHAFTDADDQVVAGFDSDAGLRLTGMTVPVQEYLDVHKEPTPTRNYTSKDLFTDANNKYFLNMSASNVKNAPVPFCMLPQRYAMPNAVVNELALPSATAYIPLDTTYGKNDKVVHPYVIEFKNLFRGYRYLLCITPYAQESNENPTLFGSNDLLDWQLLTGFLQPIATPIDNKFLSDNGFCYDPLNGMLICYWRESFVGSTGNQINYRATRDGIDWTDSALLLEPDPASLHLSPSVLFNPNDGLWHLWIGENEGILRHYTAKHLNNDWTLKATTTALFDWWHAEVKWVGDKYVMLVNARNDPSNLYFAVSSDGDTWTRGNLLFTTTQDAIYKASFLPKFNGAGQIAFDVFYTTNHAVDPEKHRKFYHLITNYSTSTITEI